MPGFHTRDSDLIGLRCSQGIMGFKSAPVILMQSQIALSLLDLKSRTIHATNS